MQRSNVIKQLGIAALVLACGHFTLAYADNQAKQGNRAGQEPGAKVVAPNTNANTAPATTGTTTMTPTMASESVLFDSLVVNFQPGQATLSETEKENLRNMGRTMRQHGEIRQAKIAAWSDKPHPRTGNLSREDRKLADRRLDEIERFLEDDQNITSVKEFNMAERSSWVGRMFHTEQAELDAEFARRGKTEVTNDEFRVIRQEGGPSKAVVILKHEKD